MDESDESYEPIMPDDVAPTRRTSEPPPLPRLWKTPPDQEEVDELAAAKAKKKVVEEAPPPKKVKAPKPLFIKKEKKKEPVVDDGTGATKLEETPVLDTYEARQRARWLIGGLIAFIGGLFLFVVFGAFGGGGNGDVGNGELPDPRNLAPAPNVTTNSADSEIAARSMLENAKKAEQLGKTPAAVNLLNRLFKAYPTTASGKEAQVALERYQKKKSLFGKDGPEPSPGTPTSGPTGPRIASGPTPPSGTGPSTVAANPSTNPTLGPNPNPNSNPAAPPDARKPPEVPPNANPVVVAPTPTLPIRPLPVGYRPNYDFPIHASGWPTRILADRDGGELVLIPGGIFDMGREDGEPQEAPVHRVGMSPYYIDLHEVTIRQYSLFLKESGRSLDAVKKAAGKGVDPAKIDDYPITNVSFNEAKAFFVWAKRSLPTEAQWEFAARSTNGRISFWNEQLPRPDPAKGPRVMEPVMSLPTDVSAFGVFDLGANAWEWTSEYYDSQYYRSPQFRNQVSDPAGPKESKTKIFSITVKGGSKSGILTWREGVTPQSRHPYLGFRGVLNIVAPPSGATTTKPAGPPAAGPAAGGIQQPF